MATPQRMIQNARLAQASEVPVPKMFGATAEWDGVKVAHYRVTPGELGSRIHKTHEVFIPIAGAITIESDAHRDTPMRRRRVPGEISVTPAGIRYSARWEEELEYLTVFFTEEHLRRTTIDFESNRNARIVLSCGPRDELVRSIGLALADEIDHGQPAGKLYAESLVNTLTVHLLRHYSTESLVDDLQFGGLPPHKLRRVAEFIEANLDQDLELAEIAQAAELSPYHFARSFKQTTGFTPIQFLMQRRIEHAKRLLTESDAPIVEVGLSAGFKNQSHFSTLFRKFTALTPKAYRNEFLR
ncbi:MAG TPA: AraC family transcriptional regulator [Blastocatellia bacterium]|nr:AraC family transcriptional regulator [Blastocatellia bacterium]HMY74110.1 AraC family transcriptional regulator [Blastocatellia bacterium]HMZ22588.1 AraC family transcriptional regulator [Blastocatellia bacterium]HNG34612.1 AraC family transcriptional regulator [Blastocatellia bacterium]